jgi:hypothetical protein
MIRGQVRGVIDEMIRGELDALSRPRWPASRALCYGPSALRSRLNGPAGACRTQYRILTTNYESKSRSRRTGDQLDEKIVIVRGALWTREHRGWRTVLDNLVRRGLRRLTLVSGAQGQMFTPLLVNSGL